jgi:hypothetical protein
MSLFACFMIGAHIGLAAAGAIAAAVFWWVL